MAQQVIQIKNGQIDQCSRALLLDVHAGGRGITVSQFARYTDILGSGCELTDVGFSVSDSPNNTVRLGGTWGELPLELNWSTGQEVRVRLYARRAGAAWNRETAVGGTHQPIGAGTGTTQMYEAILSTDGNLRPVSAHQSDDWELHLLPYYTATAAQLDFTNIDLLEATIGLNKTIKYEQALRPMLIDSAEAAEESIRVICGRDFSSITNSTRTFYTDSYRALMVDDIGQAGTTVTVDGVTVPSRQYRFNDTPSNRKVATMLLAVGTYCFPTSYPISVRANFGWSKVPQPIVQAATELAQYNYLSSREGHVIGRGDYGYQYVRARVPNVMRLITPYIRRSA